MSTRDLPEQYQDKINALKAHFQEAIPSLTVDPLWEKIPRRASFPFFDEKDQRKHLLQVPYILLDDYTADKIIEMLGESDWKSVLNDLPSNQAAIFTTTGFKFVRQKD